MIGTALTAIYRWSMLEKLLKTERAQRLLALVKPWYDRQPRKVQMAAAAAVLALAGLVLFS